MICIFRRLTNDNNFVNFPRHGANLSTTDHYPMNRAYSHRFSLSYSNGSFIPDSAVVRENIYYNNSFYEIEV